MDKWRRHTAYLFTLRLFVPWSLVYLVSTALKDHLNVLICSCLPFGGFVVRRERPPGGSLSLLRGHSCSRCFRFLGGSLPHFQNHIRSCRITKASNLERLSG